MNLSRIRIVVPAVLVLALVVTAFAGGWAVITAENVPEYLVAGKPSTITFLIRQHGFTLADGMNPNMTATDRLGQTAKAVVTPTGKVGQYKAILTVPQPGDWTIKIDGALGEAIWQPIKGIRPEDPVPAPHSQIARGEQLYVAKGCFTCHVNSEVTARTLVPAGPDLTGKKFSQGDYLKKFLADPAKTKGKAERETMPNLNLSVEEIDAIAAFINRART